MPALLSASSLKRAKACPASCVLPSVSEQSDAGIAGTIAHEALRLLSSGADENAVLSAIDEQLATAAIQYKLAPSVQSAINKQVTGLVSNRSEIPQGCDSEVAFAYDPSTGKARVLQARDRAYDLQPGEIPGTADLVGWGKDEVLICDYKNERIAYEDHSAQLNFYALCAARVWGVDTAHCRVLGIGESGEIVVTAAWSLDWEDLIASENDLRGIRDAVEQERIATEANPSRVPDVTLGDHCRYCPAWRSCPAYQGAIKALTDGSTEDLGQAYLQAQIAERAAESVRDLVRTRLTAEGAISLGDGRSITLDSAGRTRIKKDATSKASRKSRSKQNETENNIGNTGEQNG